MGKDSRIRRCGALQPRAFAGVVLALLLVLVLPAVAQQYVFRTFRQAQGLNNLTITSAAFDRQGFLWVGTQNGLYRFLGDGFQRFGQEQGIAEKGISAVLGAGDGTVWAGTEKNLYRWNGSAFQPAGAQPVPVGTPDSIAFEGPGSLLIQVGAQVGRLRYQPVAPGITVEPLYLNRRSAAESRLEENKLLKVAPGGDVWLGCGRQMCQWHGGVLRVWGPADGLPEEVHSTLAFGRDGSVWVAGERSVLQLPAGGAQFVDRTPPPFAQLKTIFQIAMAADPAGRMVVSGGDGLNRWDGAHWQPLGVGNGLDAGSANPLLFDPAGDLWMGTFGSGVRQWVGYQNWEGWTDRQGLPSSNVWSVEASSGATVTLGTQNGPATVDARTGEVLPWNRTTPWQHGTISAMLGQPDGGLLLATINGDVLLRPAGSQAVMELAQLKTFVYQIFRDSSGQTFLLSYRRGLLELQQSASGWQLQEVPGLQALQGGAVPVYKACTGADGTDWFSTRTGVVRLSGGQWQRVPVDGLPTAATKLRGLTCARDGSLWGSGSEFGIWHLQPQGDHLHATELALPRAQRTLSVLDIFSDSRGWVWLATDDGLMVWNGSTWAHLDQESGLIWNDLNQFNLREGTDGSIWAGTSGGASHLRHPEAVFQRAPPVVAAIEFRRGGVLVPPAAQMRMPWSQLDLSIQFAATGNFNRDDMLYRYRIAGLQPEWTDTREATVHLSALPPGRYQFQVHAVDGVSGVQSRDYSVDLRVDPPWWRTWWAYVLYGLCLALAVLAAVRLRTRQVVAQRKHLESLVNERTAELEASRQELYQQATHDALTGLLNRSAILSEFETEFRRAREDGHGLMVVLADIDHFKRVNDEYGHVAGDEALRRFADALCKSLRPGDHAGRYGGEEFLLLLPGVSAASVQERIDDLHRSITGVEVAGNKTQFVITCSLGALLLQPMADAPDRKRILVAVDEALYQAKGSGRNRAVLRMSMARSGERKHYVE